MKNLPYKIRIISAPSILGLRPNTAEMQATALLNNGLLERTGAHPPVTEVPTFNTFYSANRDPVTNCLNPVLLRDFSETLMQPVADTLSQDHFAMVAGGDCSILLGILPELKKISDYALIYIDSHADFYQPERSTTGEVADMVLAIATGRGPDVLTNIHELKPYVKDENVIHIGQRDQEETIKYRSQEIRETEIHCIGINKVQTEGIAATVEYIHTLLNNMTVAGYWIHFDTDVLADDINPAVDYRLPGGLRFEEASAIINSMLQTGKVAGMSITGYNPTKDPQEIIAKGIVRCLENAFNFQVQHADG
ncbi:arginase family protein [Pseudoflavitalea sp. G-6-1-2]|uniref:arginase family protein n=1 Tax=Pseudoflavitalea sp. G-6-1-2 TaxID=2728841 RepID=UPI00146C6CB6|nr:arginase family protein [Pseudoflavitalea sp. G-6-1-2]NML23572.1 arginase family protein [Pseudoflavitalea sp. G-6-1-2]